ncbi:helix-turn-helix domain-containing protein [Streptococcus suis]|uniref:Transcriptional regulator n=2 Tax=Streptococcus TaxID=1301 RepID=A0A4T2GJM2_STRSU|nr:helix-turn-helix domain-containing protein [Streptococcus sp. 29896]MBL6538817.1 helix-turn-helix domain-containing protein [Streptococcus suis]MBM7270584.1 helix-turn-helix domain-containing protein [Streptococcus suis]MCK4028344.1 transcriptional regulator [Streptococcus suis]TIH98080.1 transcriptional regulator [Streptococcus suis]WNY46846.1 helix-turn-helix domain-containing protein [Streptococcus sp. 29896]
MDKERVLQYFPQAKWSNARPQQGEAFVKLVDGQYLTLGEGLSDRERFLLDLLQGEGTESQQSPWRLFLDGKRSLPQPIAALQFVQVRLWSDVEDEVRQAWRQTMEDLLPNLVAWYASTASDYVFVLEQSPYLDCREILRDTLSALEFDFGLRLTVFVGQVWPEEVAASWPQLFQQEEALFQEWCQTYNHSTLLQFSQLFLWSGKSYASLKTGVAQLVSKQDLGDVIRALWAEGAVLTKTAQRLYIHRNTLQYRLDKWQEWTGLQLKELNDLAVCYHAIIDDEF